MRAKKCKSEEELVKKLGELTTATLQFVCGTCLPSETSIPPLQRELWFWKAEVSYLPLNVPMRIRF